MKGKRFVRYYVPVDHQCVVASSTYSASQGDWYGGGNHSTLTVAGKAADGSAQNIALRGQITLA